MLESLRGQISDAEDMGVHALNGLKNRVERLEEWADDGISYLRETKSTPLMIGAAAASLGAMALYALYSYWRAPVKTRAAAKMAAKVVAAGARKQARKQGAKLSRKIAKSVPHKAMEKIAVTTKH